MAFKTLFRTALTNVDTAPKEELGVLRVEHDSKYGERTFRYVQNRSGGALNADSLVMFDGPPSADVTANGGSTGHATRAAGSFITDKYAVGDLVYVVDDGGAAGAAPEGESSFITKVVALRIDFSPVLSAALANTDKVNCIKRFSIIAAAAKAVHRAAGIPMANIADGSFGWVQNRGIYQSADVVAAGTALAEGDRLAAGAAILIPLATVANNASVTDDINDQAIATVLQPLATDTVRRKACVMLNCL